MSALVSSTAVNYNSTPRTVPVQPNDYMSMLFYSATGAAKEEI